MYLTALYELGIQLQNLKTLNVFFILDDNFPADIITIIDQLEHLYQILFLTEINEITLTSILNLKKRIRRKIF